MRDTAVADSSVYIVGAGSQTPLGRSVPSAAAAVRGKISAYAEHPFIADRLGEPLIVARAKWLDASLRLDARLVALASQGVHAALAPLARFSAKRPVVRPLLALPAEACRRRPSSLHLVEQIVTDLGFSCGGTEVVSEGHAGGLLALETAHRDLCGGGAQFCLVGGVDSWLDPDRLRAADAAGQLRSNSRRWGFTPGEGAGFCLLASGAAVRRFGIAPMARLTAVSTGRESHLLGAKSVCLGDGLTTAFRGVLEPGRRVSQSYCDLNGEVYRADEFALACCRTSERFEDVGRFTAAAECWGDMGSASGLLLLTLPLAAWERGRALGDTALVWCSSARTSLRGAALVEWTGDA